MKTALICGVTGQDGSYLAELLLEKGYRVFGTSRNPSAAGGSGASALGVAGRIELLPMKPADYPSVLAAIERSKPDEIYALAGQSSVLRSVSEPTETTNSIVLSTLNLLEAIRTTIPKARLYNAGSAECFGELNGMPATEETPFHPISPYAVAKAAAHMMVVNYREAYGLHASNGILFNHESPLRGETFVTRKITRAAAAISLGRQEKLYLGNLDAQRDWGHAREYVRGMWMMLQQDEPDDYVLATGVATPVRTFVQWAFEDVGIAIEWRGEGIEEKGHDAATGKCLVEVDRDDLRPAEIGLLIGDASKAHRKLGWRHEMSVRDLAREMVHHDLEAMRTDADDRTGDPRERGGDGDRLSNGEPGSEPKAPTMPPIFELEGKRVWVAGERGMVGSAIVRRLQAEGCEILSASRDELDLADQAAVRAWMDRARPDAIFMAAARVGGILANASYPADFVYDNLVIQTNVIEAAHRAEVPKLLFLGSSCIYPKFAAQPIREDSLLTGSLEPTNEWYAIAKIAGIKLAEAYRLQFGHDFISAMPTNLYGPGDKFDLQTSHVLPALIRKAHEAREAGADSFTIWGTGEPYREFLHVDDCADACVHLMKRYSDAGHVNIGSGEDLTILSLAQLVCDVVGYRGAIVRDESKPDGTPRKLMSAEKIRSLGWTPRIGLREGIAATYQWFLSHGR